MPDMLESVQVLAGIALLVAGVVYVVLEAKGGAVDWGDEEDDPEPVNWEQRLPRLGPRPWSQSTWGGILSAMRHRHAVELTRAYQSEAVPPSRSHDRMLADLTDRHAAEIREVLDARDDDDLTFEEVGA
jgi:hypothetical protein